MTNHMVDYFEKNMLGNHFFNIMHVLQLDLHEEFIWKQIIRMFRHGFIDVRTSPFLEESIYTLDVSMDSITVLKRLIELLEYRQTNKLSDVQDLINVRECMWLLNFQFGTSTITEYLALIEAREGFDKEDGKKINRRALMFRMMDRDDMNEEYEKSLKKRN